MTKIVDRINATNETLQTGILTRRTMFAKHLDNVTKTISRDNVHIYRFYFVASVVILVSIIYIYFKADHVTLKIFSDRPDNKYNTQSRSYGSNRI